MHYYLYRITSGRLQSDSAEEITPKEGSDVLPLQERSKGVWNEGSKSFDDRPADTRLSKADFFKKVGLLLFGKVVVAAQRDVECKILLEYINGLDPVNLSDPEMIYGLNLLVTKGVWTQKEVDKING